MMMTRRPIAEGAGSMMVVFFDIDDTLLDHEAAARAGAAALHRSLAAAAPVEQFVTAWAAALDRNFPRYLAGELTFQGQRRERIREVVDGGLTDEAADAVFAGYQEAYESAWTLFPDVLPCLDALSDGRVGIISNGQVEQQHQKLVHTGIAGRFASIVISEGCGCSKPSPEIFLEACRQVGASARDAFYVGDRYDIDAVGARQAGLTGVWLDRRRTRTALQQDPVIGTLDELAGVLRR
jgi:putative hydrolase of the HAD superfamily